MNLVVSRTLLTLIFSSDTPVESSSVSIEYDEIVGLSVACLSNIEAYSTRTPTASIEDSHRLTRQMIRHHAG